jgi:NAD(P)-dependent dehydrogenase (short-subunit alcohol dehydrogenase family)
MKALVVDRYKKKGALRLADVPDPELRDIDVLVRVHATAVNLLASKVSDGETLRNSAFSAFLVGQQAARLILGNEPDANGTRGTIIFTNASAALKGFPSSGAFAMACHAKSGLAQSMARELMPQGIHIANVPIDAAIGWTQEDGTRAHRLAGTTVDDNMADPDHIAKTYLQLHHQHRSTWAFEVVLRPWVEKW